jgi:hypothetical protein
MFVDLLWTLVGRQRMVTYAALEPACVSQHSPGICDAFAKSVTRDHTLAFSYCHAYPQPDTQSHAQSYSDPGAFAFSHSQSFAFSLTISLAFSSTQPDTRSIAYPPGSSDKYAWRQ